MARFKIFPVLVDKLKRATQSTLDKLRKQSMDWFKDRVQSAFGKRARVGTFDRKEIEAQQKAAQSATRPTRPPTTTIRRTTTTTTPDSDLRRAKADDGRGTILRGNSRVSRALQQNTSLDATFKRNLRNVGRPVIGKMYFFIYDPKWKHVLPYYDVFPLVVPIHYYPDGFLGMNLHYLPYIMRAKLLDFLFSLAVSQHVGGKEDKYMQVSYGVLKSLAKDKHYEHTIKRYLYSHVKSPFAEVLHEEWEVAAFMPVEQFRKKNKREVWKDAY